MYNSRKGFRTFHNCGRLPECEFPVCGGCERGWRRLFAVVAHELDALLHFGHVVVPVVFVFQRDVPLEVLLFQLVEDALDLPVPSP